MQAEATTPVPEKEETTASGEKEAITSEGQTGEPAPSSEETEKKVVELESKIEGLEKQVKQSQDLQRQADRRTKVEKIERKKVEDRLEKIRSGEVEIGDEEPEGETSTERDTRLKAKNEIMGLILDNPEYQEVIKKDLTLKDVIRNNPFALIGNYLDSEDAVVQIKDKLDERVSFLKAEKEKSQSKKETKEGEGKEFEAGAVQPSDQEPAKEESSDETPSVDSIEQSIRNKISVAK